MTEEIKKILGITNSDFDNTINLMIEAGIEDLTSVGIAYNSSNPLMKIAVQTYVKAHFDEENREKLTEAYEVQKDNIRKKQAYRS